MPTYTAVAGGGNWNVAATWGGGGFPVAGDTAILNATSGQVTVTGTDAVCLILNCTGYANTLTIANGRILNVFGTGAEIRLGGTIDPSTTGELSTRNVSLTSAAISIFFNGVTIPRLTLGYIAGAGTQTVTINGTTPTVQNLTVNNGVSATTQLANIPLNISTSLVVGFGAGGTGTGTISGVAFNFIGTACSVNCTAGLGSGRINSGFTVASGCTLTLLSTLQIGGGTVTFSSGSFLAYSGSFGLYLNAISTAVTLDTSNVTWHNIIFASSVTVSISSDINVLTSFTNTASGSSPFVGTAGAAKNINIGGSFTINNSVIFNMSNTIINLIGTGVLDGPVNSFISGGASGTTININGTGSYTIGTATRNYLGTEGNVTINLVGTSVATVNAGHTLSTRTLTPLTLNTNNTGTGANILGGSEIIWQNFTFGSNTILSLTYETKFAGNLTGPSAGSGSINGQKFLLGGNITTGVTGPVIGGTSTIELYGSNTVNWNTAGFNSFYLNNIVINKSGGTVNLLGTINWGFSGRTLSRTTGNINAGTSTVIIPNIIVTINNMVFNNLTITAGTPTITQNTANTINSTLQLNGNATFAGTAGWTCATLLCTTNGSTITLQNSVTYRTTTGVQLVSSLSTQPITMQSVNLSIRAIWTLDYGATQNIIYVNGTRIDSSLGQIIWTFGGLISTTPLGAETLNWRTGTRPGTIAYVSVR